MFRRENAEIVFSIKENIFDYMRKIFRPGKAGCFSSQISYSCECVKLVKKVGYV